MAGKIDAIDGMRGLSMVYIVGFWHLAEYHPGMAWMLNEVTLRVTVVLLALFVMISGYLAGRPMAGFSAGDLGRYFSGKFKKIVLPFYLVLPIFAACHLLGTWGVIKAALLVSIFVPPAPPTLWFVLMTIVFLILVPIIQFVAMRVERRLLWGGVLAFCLIAAKFIPFCDERLLLYLPIFVFGMLMARQTPRIPAGPPWILMAVVVFLTSGWLSLKFGSHPERAVESIPMALSGAWLLWRLVFGSWEKMPIFLKVIATRVAACSYFLYLIHRPVYDLASRQLHLAMGPVSLALLMPILAFLAALLFQKIFEKWVEPAAGWVLPR